MTQEEKQLLLVDLCARLPYGVRGLHREQVHELFTIDSREVNNACIQVDGYDAWFSVDTFKPYLRPLSSMTEEEEKEIRMLHHCFYREGNGWITAGVFGINDCGCTVFEMVDILNYLNEHHFDYRGLIEKGLAIEAPEGMYK